MTHNTKNVVKLEDMARWKIAVTLWMSSNITIKMLDSYYQVTKKWILDWKYMENKLPLPYVLEQQIYNLVPFIGCEVFKFVDYLLTKISIHKIYLKYCLSKLCWKEKGIVDRKKTVEILIEESTLNLLARYKLACAYCLEDDILRLWCELSEDQKFFIVSDLKLTEKYLNSVYIWSLFNEKQETLLSQISVEQGFASVCLYKFVCSVNEGVPEAAIYYWLKILPEDKFDAIYEAMVILDTNYYDELDEEVGSALDSKFYEKLLAEIIVFLFTQISDEDIYTLRDELELFFYCALTSFLEWPFLELFINTFEKLQRNLQSDDYLEIIKFIVNKIVYIYELGIKDDSYLLIFQEVWAISSETNKESIYFYLPSMISNLLHSKGETSVSLILDDLPPSVREDLFLSDDGITECMELASYEEWDRLELIIKMCVPQKKFDDFQSVFKNQMQSSSSSSSAEEDVDSKIAFRMFYFLESLIRPSNSESPPLKKFCSDVTF